MSDEELYLNALANHKCAGDYPDDVYDRSGWAVMWHEAMQIKPPPFVQDGKVVHPTPYSSVRVIEGRVIAELGWTYGAQPLGHSITPELTSLCVWERRAEPYSLEEAKAKAADAYIKAENTKIDYAEATLSNAKAHYEASRGA